MRTLLFWVLCQGLFAAPLDPWSESYKQEYEKQYDKAIKALNSQARSGEYVIIRLGYLNYLKGNYPESLKHYQSALSANPHSYDARLGVISALAALTRWNEAATEAQKIINECPWHQTACQRMLVCREGLGQWDQVLKLSRELVRRYPSDYTALLYWARSEAKAGNRHEAKKAYQRLLQVYPSAEEAYNYFKR